MSGSEFLLLASVVALAAFVQGTIGIGFALIVAPTVAWLRPQMLPITLLLLMLPLNFTVAARERSALDRSGASWIVLGRVLGTPIGLILLIACSRPSLNPLVGGAILFAAGATALMPPFAPNRKALIAVGLFTGITEIATGVGGPPLALAYQHRHPKVFRATVAACFLTGELLSLALLISIGQSRADRFKGAVFLLPFLLLGTLISSVARHRINHVLMRRLVIVFAFISGGLLMVRF